MDIGALLVNLLPILASLAVIAIIFLVCREIVCWYWKINERLEMQREIRNEVRTLTRRINILLDPDLRSEGEEEDEDEEDEGN